VTGVQTCALPILIKCQNGVTALEEILRVTQEA
jgi:hypothetical protein